MPPDSPDVAEIETRVGELFEIELEGIPTSGFRWEVEELPGDRFRLVEQDVDAEAGPIGGGAVERFRFQALAPGEAEIRFVHRRPWETTAPVDERVYRVSVED